MLTQPRPALGPPSLGDRPPVLRAHSCWRNAAACFGVLRWSHPHAGSDQRSFPLKHVKLRKVISKLHLNSEKRPVSYNYPYSQQASLSLLFCFWNVTSADSDSHLLSSLVFGHPGGLGQEEASAAVRVGKREHQPWASGPRFLPPVTTPSPSPPGHMGSLCISPNRFLWSLPKHFL